MRQLKNLTSRMATGMGTAVNFTYYCDFGWLSQRNQFLNEGKVMNKESSKNSDVTKSTSDGLDRRSLCKGILGVASAIVVPASAFGEVPVGLVIPGHDDHTDKILHTDTSHSDYHNDVHFDDKGDHSHVDHHSDFLPRPAHVDGGETDVPHHLDHSDAGHSDHADFHLDDHGDAAFPAFPHGDAWCPPHADHVDANHADIKHIDSTHFDTGPSNHTDLHTDVTGPHTDGADHTDSHYDWHTDLVNDAHNDHTDVPHYDSPPHDDHTDHSDHGDAAHFDIKKLLPFKLT